MPDAARSVSPRSGSRATTAQEDAATRMLLEAFGPVFLNMGISTAPFTFWGPRIAQAVVEAGEDR